MIGAAAEAQARCRRWKALTSVNGGDCAATRGARSAQARLRSIAPIFAPSCFHGADCAHAERASRGSSAPVTR